MWRASEKTWKAPQLPSVAADFIKIRQETHWAKPAYDQGLSGVRLRTISVAERWQSVEIPLMDTDAWATTLEFKIVSLESGLRFDVLAKRRQGGGLCVVGSSLTIGGLATPREEADAPTNAETGKRPPPRRDGRES